MSYKGFSSVQLRKPIKSNFDLGHEHRLSTRMGKLTPILCMEVMPDDRVSVNNEVMLRLAPLIAPIMHRVNVFVHTFFVPNRLLWADWEKFITGDRLGTETPPIPPRATFQIIASVAQSLLAKGSLADYMGIPNITDAEATSQYTGARYLDMMPFAAYYKIWADYYRDRNFVADPPDTGGTAGLPMISGTLGAFSVQEYMKMRTRAYEHDYFTSALPWVQRGNQVLMPLTGTGSVTYLPTSKVRTTSGSAVAANTLLGTNEATNNPDLRGDKASAASTGQTIRIENIDTVTLTASSVTINDVRRAARLQEWLERNALAGSRYNESIYAHYGIRTSDARLQRAEYISGGKVPVKISEIVTTAYSTDASSNVVPPANMAGHGLGFNKTNRGYYHAEEHGFIISLLSVMPTTAYMQGIPRMFTSRRTFLDYPWPTFANLGEQKVYNNEIFLSPTSLPATTDPETYPVFGYQSRYADWKFLPSRSSGDFRSTLDFWHLTRKFASQPALSETFVTFEDALQNRVFAVSNVDTLWCYIYNDVKVNRALPYFGTPTL